MAFFEKPTPDDTKENWRQIRLMLRLYRLAFILPLLALALSMIWGAGYSKGLLAACSPAARTETISKDSNHDRN